MAHDDDRLEGEYPYLGYKYVLRDEQQGIVDVFEPDAAAPFYTTGPGWWKDNVREAKGVIEEHELAHRPRPTLNNMKWLPVAESYPPDSSAVLITDGTSIATAHWFARTTYKGEEAGSMWANQHHVLIGRYMDQDAITHWMPMDMLRAIPFMGTPTGEEPEIVRLAPKQGWAHPLLAKKWHYFLADDLVSVCGKWMLAGTRYDDPSYDIDPDNCAACKKKVAKLRKD